MGRSTAQVVALSAQGSTPPTRGPGDTGGGGGAGAGSGPAAGQATGAILPVTGTNVMLWLVPAVLLIALGLFAMGATTRKRRRILE